MNGMRDLINKADLSLMHFCVFHCESTDLDDSLALLHHREATYSVCVTDCYFIVNVLDCRLLHL